MKWLSKNYWILTSLLLTLLIILVIVDIDLRSDGRFDEVKFNNITTPVAAIISVGLFAYLTFRQLEIQASSNLKQNLDHHFNHLKEKLEESITDRVTMIVGNRGGSQAYIIPEINSLDYTTAIGSALDRICSNADYIEDHTAFLNNRAIIVQRGYLNGRSYFDDLRFVLAFATVPTFKYDLIEYFLDEINQSVLVATDRAYFKRKVEALFLDNYFHLVIHRGGIDLPDYYSQSPQGVGWTTYRASGLDRFLVDFRKKLE